MTTENLDRRRARTGKLLNISEKAKELGVTIETLRQWRKAGTGPAYVRYGNTVRYWPETQNELAE